MKNPFPWLLASLTLFGTNGTLAVAETYRADVCVYGGTAAGVVAAVQTVRQGKSVLLLEPGRHLGGMTSGGLGQTDIGNKGAIGGISREFYRRLGKHYGKEESWIFEPSVAEQTFHDLLREAKVIPQFNHRLSAVKKSGSQITGVVTENGDVFRAKIFIDATYEGDLMARAGVSYTVGREANATYQETLNGVRAKTPKHQFLVDVDPYKIPGDPSSGLIPLIQSGDGGVPGSKDRSVQAYNFRLCVTQNPTNRLPIAPPSGYTPATYELLARYLEARVARGDKLQLGMLMHIQMMPNGKTDINNDGGFSTDFIGANYDYPDGDYASRQKIWQAHEDYTRGFLHFLATSPRVPENIRLEMQSWGLCKDEFPDTGGWPHQLYIREARRMISDYVMTEHNCAKSLPLPDAIGLAAYTMDSHNCQRIVKNGRAENEGDVQVGGFPPYPIAYRSVVPKAKECSNLLVPICLSASHIAYGSIRMEPVFMVLGQSAASAACQAIDERSPVQKINIKRLQSRLLADAQIIEWKGAPRQANALPPARHLDGIVVDDVDAEKIGAWAESTAIRVNLVGESYLHDQNENKGAASVVFRPSVPKAGTYDLVLVFPPHPNRAGKVPVTIAVEGEATRTVQVNQRDESHHGLWPLGRFQLPAGRKTAVTISNQGTDGYVVADALQLLPIAN